MNIEIPALPYGKHEANAVLRPRNGMVLVRVGETVYSTRHEIDLSRSHRVNDEFRREFCGLAGIKLTDLHKAIKEHRRLEAEKDAEYLVARLESQAGALGYKLVKE